MPKRDGLFVVEHWKCFMENTCSSSHGPPSQQRGSSKENMWKTPSEASVRIVITIAKYKCIYIYRISNTGAVFSCIRLQFFNLFIYMSICINHTENHHSTLYNIHKYLVDMTKCIKSQE